MITTVNILDVFAKTEGNFEIIYNERDRVFPVLEYDPNENDLSYVNQPPILETTGIHRFGATNANFSVPHLNLASLFQQVTLIAQILELLFHFLKEMVTGMFHLTQNFQKIAELKYLSLSLQ